MDIEHIHALVKDLEIDDPAFEGTKFEIGQLPPLDGRRTLGCFYPAENLIVVTPEANESVLLHELGHRHSFFYYHNLSEGAAESFRKIYQGNHNPHYSSSLPFYAVCGILGAVIVLGLGISRELVARGFPKEKIVPIKRIGTAEEWLKKVAKGKFKVTSTHKWQAEAETAYMELKAKRFEPTLYAVADTWTTYYVTTPVR